jgi:hypothetical protein
MRSALGPRFSATVRLRGASCDGSLLEIDQGAAANFYGPPQAASVPQRVPESATKLHNYLVDLTKPATVPPPQLTPVAAR